MTLLDLIQRQVSDAPDRPALHALGQGTRTFAELLDFCHRRRSELQQLGLGADHVVAVVMPNGPAMATACLVLANTCACAPLNPEYREDEFAFYLADLKAAALLLPRHMITPARSAARALGIPVLELEEASDAGAAGAFVWVDACAHPLADTSPRHSTGDDTALLLHTSGTTSRPKLVPLSHANIAATAAHLRQAIELRPEDVCLNVMPQFHVGGLVDLLVAPLAAGGSVVCTHAFSAPHLLEPLRTFRPSWTQMVPAMLHELLAASDRLPELVDACRSLRFVRCVAAALPPALQDRFEERFGIPVIEVYGMTETATLICTNPLPPGVRKPRSVGPAAGPEVAVMDAQGHTLPMHVAGEIVVRGANVMRGYLNDPNDNRDTFHHGWFRTGDQGYLDADSHLFIQGRVKEIINRGGEKVSPSEVDEVLLGHPAVADAACYGIDHASLGENVAAAVCLRPGQHADARDIIRYLNQRLAYFKVPRTVRFVAAIPRTQNGKVRRLELRRTHAQASPGASPRGEAGSPPSERLATVVLALWRHLLERPDMALDDDFFDAGGDSLAATTFIVELNKTAGVTVPVASLFDAPTAPAYAEYLLDLHPEAVERLLTPPRDERARALPAEDEDGGPITATAPFNTVPQTSASDAAGGSALPGEVVKALLKNRFDAWRDHRLHQDSLFVGFNLDVTQGTLFWCGIRHGDLAQGLAGRLRVIGMTPAFSLMDATDANVAALSEAYLRGILELQPQGPFLLGGWCRGGRIAFQIAQRLQQLGHQVHALVLHDTIVPRPFDARVQLAFGEGSEYNPQRYGLDVTAQLPVLYRGPLGVATVPGDHKSETVGLRELAEVIWRTWQAPGAGTPPFPPPRDETGWVHAVQVRPASRTFLVARPGTGFTLEARVAVPVGVGALAAGERLELVYVLHLGDRRNRVNAIACGSLGCLSPEAASGGVLRVRKRLPAPDRRGVYRIEVGLLHQRPGEGATLVMSPDKRMLFTSLSLLPAYVLKYHSPEMFKGDKRPAWIAGLQRHLRHRLNAERW